MQCNIYFCVTDPDIMGSASGHIFNIPVLAMTFPGTASLTGTCILEECYQCYQCYQNRQTWTLILEGDKFKSMLNQNQNASQIKNTKQVKGKPMHEELFFFLQICISAKTLK